MPDDLSAVVAGRYAVDAVLGEGAYGVVYRARDLVDGGFVALKKSAATAHEAEVLRAIPPHPNVLATRGIEGEYLVCEYADGGSLRDRMGAGTTGVADRVAFLLDAMEGVAHAHAHGVVHRDLKPENVLLVGGAAVAKVADFGIASSAGSHVDAAGSPEYAAPEQFYDRCDARADVYALGVVLFEILVGRRPFDGDATALREAHLRATPPIPRRTPRLFARVLRKALEKDPERRTPDVESMSTAIACAIEAGEADAFRPDGP